MFLGRAANANGRAIAYFMRRTAELMADDYRRHRNYVRFVGLAGYPFVITRDNRVVALLPIDALSWTRETEAGFGAVTAERKQVAPKSRGELRVVGMATVLAKKKLKAEGWLVLDHQKP